MQTKFLTQVARATTLTLILGLLAACAAPASTPAPVAVPTTEAAATVAPEPTAAPTEAATAEPTSAPTAEMTTAVATAEVTATTEATATALTAEQISFNDMGLADDKVMRNESRPATAAGDANAPGPGAGEPASIRFTFPGDTVEGYVSPLQRQIVFYSVADYQALLTAEGVAEDQNPISQLTALLAEKPAPPSGTISGTLPLLPQLPGSQVFHAQVKYLTFKSGTGVRYLTRYTFDVSPIANDNLFYTFQGLSNDGQHYVSFFYPIQASALPTTSADAKTEAAAMERDYDAYILDITQKLDELVATGFTPELATLDGLVESLALSQADATASPAMSETRANLSGVVQVTTTEVIRLVPVAPDASQDGECFAGSIASTRADAYRCSVGNAIYDPCLIADDGKTLVCDVDPIGKATPFKLNLSKALPEANKADLPQHPWLLKLSDGAVCNFATGGSSLIAEQRVNYYCSDKSVIVGDLTPGTIWQALRAVPSNAGGTEFGEPFEVVVAAVWE